MFDEKNAKTLENINSYLSRIENAFASSTQIQSTSKLTWTNSDGKFWIEGSRITLAYDSPYVDTLVANLRVKKQLDVALVLSKDSYDPEKYEFTFVPANDVVVLREGSPNILEIDSADLVTRIRASRSDGLYVYLAAKDYTGAWAWARFRP